MAGARGETIGVLSSNTNINIDQVRSDTDSESPRCGKSNGNIAYLPSRPSFPTPHIHILLIPLLKDHILQEDPAQDDNNNLP
jgi:hypothetical protein